MAAPLGFCLFSTAIGECAVAWTQNKLAGVQLPEGTAAATRARIARAHPGLPEAQPPAFVAAAITRIRGLLAGARDDLADLPLDFGDLPAFQRQVYEVTRAIPPGEVLTYGEVARRLGDPGA